MGGAGAMISSTSGLTRRRLGLLVLSAPMLWTLPALAEGEGDGTAAAETPEGLDAPAPGAPGDADAPGETEAPRDPHVGTVTHLPLPRYVSLKTGQGNARRGPGLTHRIDWVFTRAGMPLKVTAEYEHWRRVEDQDGAGGWVHYSLLSGVRSVLVTTDLAQFRDGPAPDADVVYQAELNVIGKLLSCTENWARVSVDGEKGWAKKTDLWGVDLGEVFG
jgi:SH3-like domain-containing protein